ncbi:MAG: hypothetical protein JNL71_01285 [Rhodospirillales bacterium]|nr:hypothetical protein [Rhodospirillales bacterium]
MAAPAKAPAKPHAVPAKGRPAPAAKGKGKAEPAAPEAPPPAPRLSRLKLVVFGALGVAMLGTLGAASWVMYFRPAEPVYVDIPPPEPAPPRPTGPYVRQGDLSDELWRRMGVRPQGE